MAIDPGTTLPATDDTPTFDAVAAQLDDPRTILANALHRVHRADAIRATLDGMDEADWEDMARADAIRATLDGMAPTRAQLQHQLDTAQLLTLIADTARYLNGEQATTVAAAPDDDQYAPGPAGGDFQPQPVNGMRFEALLGGGIDTASLNMGIVGNREWMFMPYAGYIDITDADELPGTAWPSHRLAGRIVSVTPEHILGVTDGGTGVTLPRALIREFPDDQA
jgi:hypothetical protein